MIFILEISEKHSGHTIEDAYEGIKAMAKACIVSFGMYGQMLVEANETNEDLAALN